MLIKACPICDKFFQRNQLKNHMDLCYGDNNTLKRKYNVESHLNILLSEQPQVNFVDNWDEQNFEVDTEALDNEFHSKQESTLGSNSNESFGDDLEYFRTELIYNELEAQPPNELNNSRKLNFSLQNKCPDLSFIIRKSLDLYNIVQEENITRTSYEIIVNFFNNWILSDDFGK